MGFCQQMCIAFFIICHLRHQIKTVVPFTIGYVPADMCLFEIFSEKNVSLTWEIYMSCVRNYLCERNHGVQVKIRDVCYERLGVSNHLQLCCLFNNLFRLTTKKQKGKLLIAGYCEENHPEVGSPHSACVTPDIMYGEVSFSDFTFCRRTVFVVFFWGVYICKLHNCCTLYDGALVITLYDVTE